MRKWRAYVICFLVGHKYVRVVDDRYLCKRCGAHTNMSIEEA